MPSINWRILASLGLQPPPEWEDMLPAQEQAEPPRVPPTRSQQPTGTTAPFPWVSDQPVLDTEGKPTLEPMTGLPRTQRTWGQVPMTTQGGVSTITAPEGTATFTPGTEAQRASFIRAAGERRAQEEARGQLQATMQARQESQQQLMQQEALRRLAQANPQAFLQVMQQRQLMGGAPGAGTPALQAAMQLKAAGLPVSAMTMQAAGATMPPGARGPLAPEQHYANTLMQTLGRFGEGARGQRAATAGAAATATAAGKATVGRAQPLGERAAKWLHPETGQPAPAGMSQEEATAQGYIPATTQGMTASATAKAALVQLREYRELAPKLLTKQTGVAAVDLAKVQGNKVRLGFLRKSGDPDAKRLEGLFGSIATLARATGDTANIAVQERNFLKSFVLDEGDTVESAVAKLDQAERILRGVVEGRGIPSGGQAPGARQGGRVFRYDASGQLIEER